MVLKARSGQKLSQLHSSKPIAAGNMHAAVLAAFTWRGAQGQRHDESVDLPQDVAPGGGWQQGRGASCQRAVAAATVIEKSFMRRLGAVAMGRRRRRHTAVPACRALHPSSPPCGVGP